MNDQFFVAVLLTKLTTETSDSEPLYSESIALVKAHDLASATVKAQSLLDSQKTDYLNNVGDKVTLSPVKLIDVSPMLEDEIGGVTEIYSRYFKNLEAYTSFETLASK